MHINGSGPITNFIQGAANDQQDRQQSNQSNTPSQGLSDKVTLTGAASQLQSIEQTLVNLPEVNAQRVEQIQGIVNSGKLNTNSAQIADKMVNFEDALNGARTGT